MRRGPCPRFRPCPDPALCQSLRATYFSSTSTRAQQRAWTKAMNAGCGWPNNFGPPADLSGPIANSKGRYLIIASSIVGALVGGLITDDWRGAFGGFSVGFVGSTLGKALYTQSQPTPGAPETPESPPTYETMVA